jgi:hypothetical protein
MDDATSLTFRLESYLAQLADINRRWTQWLADSESAAMRQNVSELQTIEASAQPLFEELAQVVTDREELLADASRSGLACSDLKSLAVCLPAWEKPALRRSVAAARQQLAHLRRLHVATWVLTHHALQHYNGSMQLMTAGTAQRHVYTSDDKADTTGGRLLDANL